MVSKKYRKKFFENNLARGPLSNSLLKCTGVAAGNLKYIPLRKASGPAFSGGSFSDAELKSSTDIALDYIVAPPRMAYYIEYSTRIYNIYLKYIASEDIHVYSIDEVLIDIALYIFIH